MHRCITVLFVLCATMLSCRENPAKSVQNTCDFHRARLGMVPREAREHFMDGHGAWESQSGAGYIFEWHPNPGEASSVRAARLEFHSGYLVAIRAAVEPSDAWASGAPLQETPG